MSENYSIYSLVYLDQDVSTYNCYLNETEWDRIIDKNPTARLFARIKKRDKFWCVALGEPVKTHLYNDKTLFVPSWMLEQVSVCGDGESLEVDWISFDFFENSTHVSLKPVNFNYESSTIEEELSIELTKLGVLQKNSRIHISIPSLDNFTVVYDVVNLEPANIVLCEGDNVSLEFINDSPLVEPSAPRSSTPYPEVPEVPAVQTVEKFNPWRSKDFKPPFS